MALPIIGAIKNALKTIATRSNVAAAKHAAKPKYIPREKPTTKKQPKKSGIAQKIQSRFQRFNRIFSNNPVAKANQEFKQTVREETQRQLKKEQQTQALEELSNAENKRRTAMQENYFRMASRTEEQKANNQPLTNEQKLSRAEQSFFYAATRHLWQGGSAAMINENIVAGMEYNNLRLKNGQLVTNLQMAVQWVKEAYGDEYPTMDKVKQGKYDTKKSLEFMGEIEERNPSPLPISKKQLRMARAGK